MYKVFIVCTYVRIAIGDNDYEPNAAFIVEIPSREISVPFSISILDDDGLFEGNESISLTIDSSSLPSGLSSDCMLVIAIVDDDGELCRYLFTYNLHIVKERSSSA